VAASSSEPPPSSPLNTPNRHPVPPASGYTFKSSAGDSCSDGGGTSVEGKRYEGFAHNSLLKAEKIIEADSPSTPAHGGKIKRHEIFFEEQAEKLRSYLSIDPPQDRARPTEALSFNRSRVIKIDWQYVFSPKLVKDYFNDEPAPARTFVLTDQMMYFMSYFNDLWGLDPANYDKLKGSFVEQRTIRIPVVLRDANGNTSFSMRKKDDTWVLRHPLAERWFYIEPIAGQDEISDLDFGAYAAYSRIWSARADGVEICFAEEEGDDKAETLLPAIDEVDLAPSIIIRQ